MKIFYAGLRFSLLFLLLAGTMVLTADAQSTTYTSGKQRLQGFTNYTNASVASYLMYYPESYSQNTDTYPVLIFLNGDDNMSKGAPGDPNKLLTTGLPQVLLDGKDIPMLMAA